ncbi:MAG: hypothetical protein H5U40_05630, partial [Polyangiaceae bacterium]|nr:hypothetical protein [Polyangiaceae bacterium]
LLYVFAPDSGARFPASAIPLPDLFPFHREGVQTNRDDVAIDLDREALLTRLRAFVAGEKHGELARAGVALGHYDPERARAAVARALEADPDGARGLAVRKVAYRPYDTRYLAPIAPLCHRPRPELLAAIDRSSFALLTVRKDRGERAWNHFAATSYVPDNCFLSSRSSCRTRAFPTHGPDGAPNLDVDAARALFSAVGAAVSVEEALDYALGLLASASYRSLYGELLLRDYPRVLAPADSAAFAATRAAGAALREAFVAACDPSLERVTVGHHSVAPSASLGAALARARG